MKEWIAIGPQIMPFNNESMNKDLIYDITALRRMVRIKNDDVTYVDGIPHLGYNYCHWIPFSYPFTFSYEGYMEYEELNYQINYSEITKEFGYDTLSEYVSHNYILIPKYYPPNILHIDDFNARLDELDNYVCLDVHGEVDYYRTHKKFHYDGIHVTKRYFQKSLIENATYMNNSFEYSDEMHACEFYKWFNLDWVNYAVYIGKMSKKIDILYQIEKYREAHNITD